MKNMSNENMIEIVGCVASGPFRVEPSNGSPSITYVGIRVAQGFSDRYQLEFRHDIGRAAYGLIEAGDSIRITGRVVGHLRSKEDGKDRLIPIVRATGFSAA